jgi:copper chaperone CopZ
MDNYNLNVKISGITCEACIRLIKKKVGKLDGVSDVIIKGESGETIIKSIKQLNIYDIISALSGLPYQVEGFILKDSS